jgi:hypothetical protein
MRIDLTPTENFMLNRKKHSCQFVQNPCVPSRTWAYQDEHQTEYILPDSGMTSPQTSMGEMLNGQWFINYMPKASDSLTHDKGRVDTTDNNLHIYLIYGASPAKLLGASISSQHQSPGAPQMSTALAAAHRWTIGACWARPRGHFTWESYTSKTDSGITVGNLSMYM